MGVHSGCRCRPDRAHLHGRALGVQVQAGCLVLLREELAAIAVKAAQRQRLAVHCVRLAAKAVEDARELHADVAAADDGDLPACARTRQGVEWEGGGGSVLRGG
eukprot:83955-Chlamydomonas_euryale.AAC.1